VASASAVLTKPGQPVTDQELTAVYAGDLIHRALIESGEPLKPGEVARSTGRPDVDMKLARVVLTTNQKMTAVDRKWTLWTRYLDTRSTVDQNILKILNSYGQAMKLEHLARELNAVYGRPAEIYEEILQHLAHDRKRLMVVGDDYIAPTSWLITLDSDDPVEVLFDNFLDDEDVEPFISAANGAGLSPTNLNGVSAFLDAVEVPIKNKALQYLIWRVDPEKFGAQAVYASLFMNPQTTQLSNGAWIGPKLVSRLTSGFALLAEQEVSESAETDIEEAAQPLVIGDDEREQLVAAVVDSEDTVYADNLLEELFEVTPDFRTYAEDLRAVVDTLCTDDRVVWVGATRFRAQGTIPGYVFTVPGLLEITEERYTDSDGNLVDMLLEDDGFDGGLDREIMNPLAQDVLDEEPVPLPDMNPPSNARAVIKYHHKQIGTLPLCQFSSGFFPPEPTILETDFTLPSGQKTRVWINNETRMLYGLLDWFSSIPIDSGATFTLERQSPDGYLINYNDESEPSMFISRNRVNELFVLQERVEAENLATTDIVREIMEHYRKGIEFLTLHTEVNIVRRATRRMVASILSEYHCFFQRGGSWVYDVKKQPLGFDKSKRKYLVK
jgi:hypothetical protein